MCRRIKLNPYIIKIVCSGICFLNDTIESVTNITNVRTEMKKGEKKIEIKIKRNGTERNEMYYIIAKYLLYIIIIYYVSVHLPLDTVQ